MSLINSSQCGILLVNLGSPDSPSIRDVKRYLNVFLMDPYVLDIPYFLRALLVKGVIFRTRPKESAEAYKSIWTKEGSPLIVISKQLTASLQQKLPDIPIELGMRYGNPSIAHAIRQLKQRQPSLSRVILIPLYPHYAMASTKTVIQKTKHVIKKMKLSLSLDVLPPFYHESLYIQALSKSIQETLPPTFDRLLFSYHGVPERHLKKTDPTKQHCLTTAKCCQVASKAHAFCYRHQVYVTTQMVTKQLNLSAKQYHVSFQSRLGKDPWLTPYTDHEFERLAKDGVRHLAVVCPAFVSDCLETIEEIGMRGKETFLKAGGRSFTLIPCLNTHPAWIDALKQYCVRLLYKHNT